MDDKTEPRLDREVVTGPDDEEDDLEIVQDPGGLETRLVVIGLVVAVCLGTAIPIAVNANDISRGSSQVVAVAAQPPAAPAQAEPAARGNIAPPSGEVLVAPAASGTTAEPPIAAVEPAPALLDTPLRKESDAGPTIVLASAADEPLSAAVALLADGPLLVAADLLADESVLASDELLAEESLLAGEDVVAEEALIAGGALTAEDELLALDTLEGTAALEADEAILAADDDEEPAEPALVLDEEDEPTDLAADVESDS